jgi:hypothetical protein
LISAAELRARVVVEGVPKGNKELGVFEGTLKRVSGIDATATLHADIDQSGFTAFEGELKDVSGAKATATLEANLQGRGFDEFAARVDSANLRTSRPITQTVKAEVDQRSFASTLAEVSALKSKVDRESGGGGGLTHSAAGIIMPFGALPTAAAVASPELIALAGAATAVAGSAGEAALGVGALVGGAYGAGAVGIAGIAGVAIPAITSLKALTKAQTAYSTAVRTYGKESTQAETAAKKLKVAEKEAGPEATRLAGALRHVKTEWLGLSAPGRNDFLGALADGIDHLEGKLPLLAKSANRSTASMRHDFDLFLNQTTGKGSGFDHFIGSMTDLFVHEGPMISHTLGDWAKIFEHIAEASGPSLEMVTHQLEGWSNGILKSTGDAPKLRKEIGGLVDQTETWIHFLGQGSDLIFAIFGAGAGEGQSLVEDATGKVEDWRTAIEGDPTGTESFFAQSGEEAKELTTILAGLIGTWYQEAKAIQPIADEALHIVEALNSLKIGNVSALTVLLGTGFAVGSAAKLIKTIEILKGYGAVTGLLRAEQAEQEAVVGTQDAAAASADGLAAANDRLATSIAGVTAAQGDLAAAQAGGQLSMLEAGGVGAAEQAGQMSMFPMGGGVMPVAAESAAPVAMEEAAGGSALAGLGPALAMGAGGLVVGQVVKEIGHSNLADEVGTAIQGAGVGAAIGTAIAPGIGTAIGAALGGAGGLIIAAVDSHKSDIEEAGAKQAEDFIRGFRKERPKFKHEIETGFLGHAAKSKIVATDPTTGVQFESRTGGAGLRGKRSRLEAEAKAATSSGNPKAAAAFEKEIAAIDKAIGGIKRARTTFTQSLGQIDADVALGMHAVNHDLAVGLADADTAWGKGTKPWRAHTAEAMEAAVHAIKTGIDDGTFNAEKGQKRINELLADIHLVKGDDPFGLAKATASSFEKAGGITESGVAKWEKQLAQMPPAARRSSIDSTNKMLQGWAEGHPKIEAQIKTLTAFEVSHFGATNKQLREGVKKGATGPVAEAFAEAAQGVGGALDNIGTNMNAVLKALGAKDFVNFQAIVFGPSRLAGTQLNSEGGGSHAAGEQMHHRAEGGIVPGTASGDVHFTSVRPNSFILNKRATAAYGFAEGGMIPVALEPGELRVPPEQVARIGLGNLMAMNDSVPRFAEGGHVNVSGPRATGSAGHAALAIATQAANAYIKAHTPKPAAGYIPGGGGPVAKQMMRILLAAGYNRIGAAGVTGNALQESGWNPGAVGSGGGGLLGFTTGAISLASLKSFAKAQGKPWTDVGLQMEFFLAHEAGIRSGVDSQPNAAAAAAYFMNNWEHPAVATENQARREEGARQAMKFASGGLVGGGPTRLAAGGSAPPPGKRKDWRWTPRGGMPRLMLAEGGIADAAHVIEWAQAHLGQGPRAGYTANEWCGDFAGEDIQIHGMTPPSGYPVATNWKGWGTADPHPEYGDVVVIGGSGHVGFALGGNKMISGNFSNKVAESTIGEAAGGRPVLGYRTPPYTHASSKNPHETKAEETAHTYKEQVKKTYHGVSTDPLSLSGAIPKSVEGIEREIGRRENEVHRYEAAIHAAQKENKPGYVQKLQANVTALEKRIRELGRALRAARTKAAEVRVSTRLTGQKAGIEGLGSGIEKAHKRYDAAEQLAQQIVDLEPTIGEGEGSKGVDLGTYLRYVNSKEVPAYEKVLGAEADWRNLIIGAERRAAGDWDHGKLHVGGMEGRWEGQIEALVAHETAIAENEQTMEAFVRQVDGEIKKYHQENPGKGLSDYLKGRRSTRDQIAEKRLPAAKAQAASLAFTEKETRKTLGEGRGLFYPGGATIREPKPPNAGSGTFEGYLEEVQGIHWPGQHEALAGLPHTRHAGSYGGVIWTTQGTIEELGLNMAGAIASATEGLGVVPEGEGGEFGAGGSGPSQAETERIELLEGQLRELNQEKAINASLRPALAEFEKSYPLPYMGAFADGGVAMVGERGPELAHFPTGTRVHSAADTRSMLASPEVHFRVNGDIRQHPGDTRPPLEVELRDPRNQQLIHRIVATKQRGVVNTGATRAWRQP